MIASSTRAAPSPADRRAVREVRDVDSGSERDEGFGIDIEAFGEGLRSANRAASRCDSSCSSDRSCSPALAHHMKPLYANAAQLGGSATLSVASYTPLATRGWFELLVEGRAPSSCRDADGESAAGVVATILFSPDRNAL